MVRRLISVAEAAKLLGIDKNKLSIEAISKLISDFPQRPQKRLTEEEFEILSREYAKNS